MFHTVPYITLGIFLTLYRINLTLFFFSIELEVHKEVRILDVIDYGTRITG